MAPVAAEGVTVLAVGPVVSSNTTACALLIVSFPHASNACKYTSIDSVHRVFVFSKVTDAIASADIPVALIR